MALVPVLILVIGLMAATMALLDQGRSAKDEVASAVDDQRAELMADAALAEAVAALQAGATGAIGNADQPAQLGQGVLWVDLEDLGDGNVRLTANAMAGSGRHAKALVLHREGGGLGDLFRATINSKDTLTMNANVVVDSYASKDGDYASQAVHTTNGFVHANTNGDVLSNSDIVMNTNSTVFGDATPGPGHSVSMVPTSYVHGSTSPAPTPFEFPVIETPSYGSSGPLTVAGTHELAAGDYEFDSLTINKDATLTVHGPANIVVPGFTGGKNATLLIDATDGPVTIYCETYTHTSGFKSLPVDGSPMAVAFLVTGPNDIVFPSASLVNGAYYAEQSNILFANQSEAFGSFVANKIEMASSMKFHYDESLADYWKGGGGDDSSGVEFTALACYAAAVPQGYTADRRDPFTILGRSSKELPSPSQAWVW